MPPIPKQVSRRITPSGRVGDVAIPFDIADVGAEVEARGLGALGASISRFGQSLNVIQLEQNKIEDNRAVAEGISKYNNVINTFNESLPSLDPKEYNMEFEKLKPQIEGLTEGLSRNATEALNNRFEIWNEANRSKTAILSVRASAALAKQEIPIRLAEFASNDVSDEEVDTYLQNFSTIMSPGEIDVWKQRFETLKNRDFISSAINIAAESPTQNNIETARTVIRELSEATRTRTKEEVIFTNNNKLRTKTANRTQIKNETFKAALNTQSKNMAETYANNGIFEFAIVPELNIIKESFDNRVEGNSLDTSIDNSSTYNSMLNQIAQGKSFSDSEMTSAFATAMSRDEYEDIVKKNAENVRLTVSQKEDMGKFASYVDDKYSDILRLATPRIPVQFRSVTFAARDFDKAKIKKQIRDMVLAGEPDEKIWKAIEASFIADTDRLFKNWFKRKWYTGVNDFETSVIEESNREERFNIITDLIKAGGDLELSRIDDLLERWWE